MMISAYITSVHYPILIVAVFTYLLIKCNVNYKDVSFALIFSFMLSPSWAPASIAAAPYPFGALFFNALLSGYLSDLGDLLLIFWFRNLFMFTAMFFLGRLVGKYLFNLPRFKQKNIQGS